MRTSTKFCLVTLASALAWTGVCLVNSVRYEQQVGGFLKQAADANTIELAEKKLKQAIDGMDARGLCNAESPEAPVFSEECYTSVLWRTPDEDIGYWRTNIQATYDDLHNTTPEERADNLTASNQLMKVRETLLDHGDRGTVVTEPGGISVYPNNFVLFWWGLLSWLAFTVSFVWLVVTHDPSNDESWRKLIKT